MATVDGNGKHQTILVFDCQFLFFQLYFNTLIYNIYVYAQMIPARGPQTKVASISRTGGYLFYTSHAPCKRKTGLQR